MATLVTGGSGLIGSRIVRDLVREGEFVIAHDLNLDEEVLNYVLTDEDRKNIKFVQGDILDYDTIYNLCKEYEVDQIVHTASMMGNADKPLLAVHINTGGMIRMLEIARELKIKKMVYTSTNSIFPIAETGLIANDARPVPDGLYGCTKTFNELTADMYYRNYGVDVTGVRVSTMVFGPLQRRGVSGSMAVEAMYKPATGQPGHVLYDDEWAWIYVDDVSRAHLLALKQKRTPEMAGSYNIKGTVVAFPDLIAFVKDLIPDADIKMEKGSLGLKNWNMDMTVTEAELGYKPQWDVWDAFKHTINEMRKIAGLGEI